MTSPKIYTTTEEDTSDIMKSRVAAVGELLPLVFSTLEKHGLGTMESINIMSMASLGILGMFSQQPALQESNALEDLVESFCDNMKANIKATSVVHYHMN